MIALLVTPPALAAPPANDAFSASETMSGATVTATGTNLEATKEAGESITVDGELQIPTTAPAPHIGNSVTVTAEPDTRYVPPWTLPAIDYEAVDGDQPGENNNSVLPSSVYNSSTRVFDYDKDQGDPSVVNLPAGTYSFCNFRIGNSADLRDPATGVAKLYVDSPARAGSGCAAGTGRMMVLNSALFNDKSTTGSDGRAENLEIYVDGTLNEAANPAINCANNVTVKADVLLCNSVKFRGTIEARESTARAVNSVDPLVGGVAARFVRFDNSVKFRLPSAVRTKPGPGVTLPVRRGWFECRSRPTNANDPESGC